MSSATLTGSGAFDAPQCEAPRVAPEAICAHCGLPVPRGRIEGSARDQFCCEGCRTVYRVIHEGGLEAFYRLREGAGWNRQPARMTGQRYAEYDDPAFAGAYCKPCGDGVRSIDLLLEGVHCGACVWLIERLPRLVPGVIEARLHLRRARVRVTWQPDVVRLSQVAQALDSLGYPPHPARGAANEPLRQAEDRRFLTRLAIAGAAAGNAMLLAFALYAGSYSGMEPAHVTLLRWASALVGVVAVAWPASLFFRGAWSALRTRTAHIDVPIALGLGVGTIASLVNTALRGGDVYFDSLTMLVFLLLVARWIQSRQQRHAADAVELLFSLTPTRARRLRNGAAEEVAIESLRPGDVVEVLAHESVPVDGEVVEGHSLVDQSLLTGESRPVPAESGDRVHAGTTSLSGRLVVRVTAAGEETRVGRLMALVEDSLRRKAPIVQLMNRVAGRFIVAVLVLAAATLGLWLWLDPARAADHTIALLIVACPCALGLATPLAIAVGIGRAARRGILIKGGGVLEHLARPGALLLDKTGTVTCGRMSVLEWRGPAGLRPLVAALESRVSHPIARALSAGFEGASLPPVESAEQSAAGGVVGVVDGRRLAVGSRRFVRGAVEREPAWLEAFVRAATAQSATPIVVAVDGEIAAAAALGDDLRPDAIQCVDRLRTTGWHVGLLSGDHPDVVARVAERLRIEAGSRHGGVSPEEKLATVQALSRRQPVVMVGDGVNDAAALAAAHVGIAVHGGAEASLAAADVYLSRAGLAPIVELMHASRQTMRAIRRCLVASLAYNVAGVALAMAGLITPLAAALLMPVSSITVVALAIGVRTFGGRPCR